MRPLEALIEGVGALADEVEAEASKVVEDGAPALAGLRQARAHLEDDTFDVAIVGEVNAGKSTLVNALFFRAPVVPMKATACTAKLTVVEHSETPGADVVFLGHDDWHALQEVAARGTRGPQDAIVESAIDVVERGRALGAELDTLLGTTRRDVPFEALSRYAAADGRYTPIVGEVRLRYPHPLGRRVRIVDTPGLRDPIAGRARVTQAYLGKASVVVVALYAGTPMSRDDYEMLKEQLVKVGVDRLVIVLNKIDAVDGEHAERVIAYVDDKLRALRDDIGGGGGELLLAALANARALPASGLLGLLARTKGKLEDADFHEARFAERYPGMSTYDDQLARSGLLDVEAEVAQVAASRDGSARARALLRRAEAVLDLARHVVAGRRANTKSALDDTEKAVAALEAEQETWNRALVSYNGRLADAENRIDSLMRDLRPNERARSKRVEEVAVRMRGFGETHIRQLGPTNALADSVARRLNLTLAWQARDSAFVYDALEAYLEKLARDVPELLKSLHAEAVRGLGVEVDAWSVDRVRHLHNATRPSVEVVLPAAVSDAGFWETMFQPGEARDSMNERLRAAIDAWKTGTLEVLEKAIADMEGSVKEQYIAPALTALRRAVEERTYQIGVELACRSDASGTSDRRGALLALEAELFETDARLSSLRSRVHEGYGQLGSPGPSTSDDGWVGARLAGANVRHEHEPFARRDVQVGAQPATGPGGAQTVQARRASTLVMGTWPSRGQDD